MSTPTKTTTAKRTTKNTSKAKPRTTAAPSPAPASSTTREPAAADPVRHDVGRLEYLDPFTLVIDPYNHRRKRTGADDTTIPDPKLIASVEARGVRIPMLVRPQPDGTLGVVWGQRRRAAALISAEKAKKAGQPYALVPCLIRDDLAGADDEALIESMIENDQRMQAHARDDLDALEQLALMPMDDTKRARHARSLGYKTAEVKAANAAAKLPDDLLSTALAEEFDLVEAAEFGEVQDVYQAFEVLLAAKKADHMQDTGRGHWAHALESLRASQRRRAHRESVVAELKKARVPLVPFRQWGETRPLAELRTPLGNPLTPERHQADCPGHAAAIEQDDFGTVYVCREWEKHGHQRADGGKDRPADSAAEIKRKEAEKAKRRRTISYNRAWKEARTVRQDFIKALCARKDASDAVRTLILSTVTGTDGAYARYTSKHRTDLTAQFLGVPDPNADNDQWKRVADPFAAVIAKTGKTRWWRPLLAKVAAAIEHETMGDRAWDQPSADVRAWLTLLRDEGYVPAEVEAEIVPAAATGTAEK